jgi:putative oxidoreductase
MAERLISIELRDRLRAWQPLALRVPLGIIFIAHGARSLFGWWGGAGFPATIGAFESKLGIAPPLAALALLVELIGGILVLVGLLTRAAALGLAVSMVVAIVMVHLPNGFFMNWELVAGRGHGIEMNLALLGMSIALVLSGPGKLSLDRHGR